MKRDHKTRRGPKRGPTQRQLRAGELVRHALVDILREGDLHDAVLESASITITEVRLSPDFKHATCFIEPLGAVLAAAAAGADGRKRSIEAVEALNRHARFLRGKLGRHIDFRYTPDLRFVRDESFDEAQRMADLFNRPEIRRDLEPPASSGIDSDPDEAG